LRDVIRTCDRFADELGRPKPQYSIETKSKRKWEGRYHPNPEIFARLLVDVLNKESMAERAIIQSFDPRTLQQSRKLDAGIRLSLLTLRRHARRVRSNVARLGFVPAIYSPDHRAVDRKLVRSVHAIGMSIIPWTINDVDRMLEVKQMGCDGLITDYPDRALAHVG